MSKLSLCLLCFLAVAFGGAAEENKNVLGETQAEVSQHLVKREALPEAKKNKRGNGKKGGRNENNSGKKGKGKGPKRRKNGKKGKGNGRNGKDGKEGRTTKKKNGKKWKGNGRKGGKKGKKGRRTLKKKNGKKGKKSGRNAKISKKGKKVNTKVTAKNKSKPSPRQSANCTSCVAKFIEYSRINELKARSVSTQVNRINRFKGIQDNKKGKKGDFKATYDTLLSALGGNESAPECDGNPINASTKAGGRHTGTLSTLKTCESDIEKGCNYELSTSENKTFQDCLTAAKKFQSEFKTCFKKKSSAEACACVDTIDTVNYKLLKGCETKTKSDDITQKKKACVKVFIKCKSAQDDSVEGVASCKKVNKCEGGERPIQLPSVPTPTSPPTQVATSAPGGGRQIMQQIMKRAAFSKK